VGLRKTKKKIKLVVGGQTEILTHFFSTPNASVQPYIYANLLDF
jgi:hypothetical protein